MGLFDRLGRVVRANVNDMISKAEDPEKMLEQALSEMQEDYVKLREAVAKAIASQRRTQQQYEGNVSEADKWQQRAQLALSKGEETLAREALQRKKSFKDAADQLKPNLDQQTQQVDALKRNLVALESKIAEAKTKKDMYKSRMKAAEANKQLQKQLGGLQAGTSGAMSAFERMEEKVMELEASSQAYGELGSGSGAGVEDRFAQLESGSDVEDELSQMKALMQGGSPAKAALPEGSSQSAGAASNEEVDDELEALRRQLNQ